MSDRITIRDELCAVFVADAASAGVPSTAAYLAQLTPNGLEAAAAKVAAKLGDGTYERSAARAEAYRQHNAAVRHIRKPDSSTSFGDAASATAAQAVRAVASADRYLSHRG